MSQEQEVWNMETWTEPRCQTCWPLPQSWHTHHWGSSKLSSSLTHYKTGLPPAKKKKKRGGELKSRTFKSIHRIGFLSQRKSSTNSRGSVFLGCPHMASGDLLTCRHCSWLCNKNTLITSQELLLCGSERAKVEEEKEHMHTCRRTWRLPSLWWWSHEQRGLRWQGPANETQVSVVKRLGRCTTSIYRILTKGHLPLLWSHRLQLLRDHQRFGVCWWWTSRKLFPCLLSASATETDC